MAHAAPAKPENTPETSGLRRALPLALVALLLGVGFLSTYQGFWAPLALLQPPKDQPEVAEVAPAQFVGLPQIALTLAGSSLRTLVMSVEIETDAAHAEEVRHLLPRISDAFNSFLASIDPVAFERRGILDIIRDELATRAVHILGEGAFSDILITEFRIQ